LNKAHVKFQIDGSDVGETDTDATGLATITYTIPAATIKGSHAIHAVYGGATYYLASDGGATLTGA